LPYRSNDVKSNNHSLCRRRAQESIFRLIIHSKTSSHQNFFFSQG
jgi:hypothetical protein